MMIDYTSDEVKDLVAKASCQESHARMFILDKKGESRAAIASRFGYSEMTIDGYIKTVEHGLKGESYCMLEHYNPSFCYGQ
jgi:hypothetical protein